MFVALVLIIASAISTNCENHDSYIDAYKTTHGLNKHSANKSDRDVFFVDDHPQTIYKPNHIEYDHPADNYGPPKDVYGPPKDIYGPPNDIYGPPKQIHGDVYGPPKENYGPPIENYGPPKDYDHNIPHIIKPVYGPPPNSISFYEYPKQIMYSVPGLLFGLLDKLKFKLNLFTIGKIILKLVIFKKIVSLIAILCLLMFIPSLKSHDNDEEDHHHDDEMDMERSYNQKLNDEQINRISNDVWKSIDRIRRIYNAKDENCEGTYCKVKKALLFESN